MWLLHVRRETPAASPALLVVPASLLGNWQSEAARFDARRMSVATKCSFCMDRVDLAKVNGLIPGVDPEVTPACVNSCIAGVLAFGDKEDPHSNVSQLLDETQHFRMHEELGTDPGFYYISDKK